MNDKIETLENAIRHINTAIDVDPWAKQTAIEAMRYMIASLVSKSERMRGWIPEPNCMYRCPRCGNHYPDVRGYMTFRYCPSCGADMREGQDGNS